MSKPLIPHLWWCARCEAGSMNVRCWSCGELCGTDEKPRFTPHPYRPPVEQLADPLRV